MACVNDRRGVCRVLVGKPDGKGPLEDLGIDGRVILKMDLEEVGWGDMDLIALADDRDRWEALVNAIMTLRVP